VPHNLIVIFLLVAVVRLCLYCLYGLGKAIYRGIKHQRIDYEATDECLIYRNSYRDFKIPCVEITGLKVVSVLDTVGPLPSKMPGSTSYLLVSSTGRKHPIAICVTNFAAMLRSIKQEINR
jgi:hypothetical protein